MCSTRRPRRSRRRAAAIACAHVFSLPRSRAARTTPRSIAAWRSPVISTSRTTIAATIHAGTTPLPDEHHEHREHEHLVGDRVEQRAERRGAAVPAREPPVEPVGRHRDAEDRGRPVGVAGEVPGEEQRRRTEPKRPARRSADRRTSRHAEENTARSCSTRFSSPTGARSRSASSARCASSGSARVAVYSEGDRGALHVAYADESFLIGPTPAAESYLARRADPRRRGAGRRAGDPSRLRLPRRERGFARAVEDAGLVWIGPPPAAIELMGNKTAARTAMQDGRRADHPRHDRSRRLGRGAARARRGDRLPAPDQGGGGRRRQGDGGRALARRRRSRRSRRRGARGSRTSRTPTSTSRSSSSTRATSRCRCSPTRTATSSISASATARSSAATRSSSRRRRRRRSTRSCARGSARSASTRRARRATARPGRSRACSRGRRLLLHGDEHAHPGRAHGDRDGHRARPRARADPRRARRAALGDGRRTSSCAATRSSAGSTPRTRARASFPRPAPITGYREPAGPGVRVDSGVAAGYEVSGVVRPDDREAHRPRRRPRARPPADAARARRVLDRGAARR